MRRTLKKGMQGDDVLELTRKLSDMGLMAGPEIHYNNDVRQAVRIFQTFNLDSRGRPLGVDGVCGPLTWWSIDNDDQTELFGYVEERFQSLPEPQGESELARKALEIAINEMNSGAREEGGNNAGPFPAKYHGITPERSLEARWAWCAAFVSWCVKQACLELGVDMPFAYTGGARNIRGQLLRKGKGTEPPDLKPGDIVVWWRDKKDGWKGHVGFVYEYKDGILYTIEGNRGRYPSAVRHYDYVLSREDRLLGFVRI